MTLGPKNVQEKSNFTPDALLRGWQNAALKQYLDSMPQDFLAQVTPGGGKTIWALYVARTLLNQGYIDRLVIVAPTIVIKRQWQREAKALFGLDICELFDPLQEEDGFVTTYAQVASQAEFFALYASELRVMAIFDEVHHAGEKKSWGDAANEAFRKCRRLSLTGTPFRSDSNKIAFVNYDDGTSVSDFVYSYAEAVQDGYCRQVEFPIFGGMASWQREGEAAKEAELGAKVPTKDKLALHKAVLQADGGFVASMLQHAHGSVCSIPGAAGLVLADNQEHARGLADTLRRLTGEKVVLALSDEPGSVKRIREFRESEDRWIVTVRMVSEGVDIPRIRSVCYLTRYKTDLFFQQAVGRCVRGTGKAWFYVPDIAEIKLLAATCFDVQTHLLKDVQGPKFARKSGECPSSELEILGSEGFLCSQIIFFRQENAPRSKEYLGAKIEDTLAWHREHYKANKEAIAEKKKKYREANKETVAAKMREYREANKEALAAKMREYREANKEALVGKDREYYKANKEAIAAKMREYREANKKAISDKMREYYKTNREEIVERRRLARRLAKEKRATP